MIEKVQKMYTRVIFKKCGLAPKSYAERLFICQPKELRARRINADLCMVFKIIKNMTNLKPSNYFTITKRSSRKPYS